MKSCGYSIFVRNLPKLNNWSSKELEEKKKEFVKHFEKYGKIQNVYINLDYGFVNYEEEKCRNSALVEDGQLFKNMKIEVAIQLILLKLYQQNCTHKKLPVSCRVCWLLVFVVHFYNFVKF